MLHGKDHNITRTKRGILQDQRNIGRRAKIIVDFKAVFLIRTKLRPETISLQSGKRKLQDLNWAVPPNKFRAPSFQSKKIVDVPELVVGVPMHKRTHILQITSLDHWQESMLFTPTIIFLKKNVGMWM